MEREHGLEWVENAITNFIANSLSQCIDQQGVVKISGNTSEREEMVSY